MLEFRVSDWTDLGVHIYSMDCKSKLHTEFHRQDGRKKTDIKYLMDNFSYGSLVEME